MPRNVVHCKREAYDVYIGRPSEWGNAYTHDPKAVGPSPTGPYLVGSREEAIEHWEAWMHFRIFTEPGFADKLRALHGKVLGCWCAPKACHGDVLVRLARELTEGTYVSPYDAQIDASLGS